MFRLLRFDVIVTRDNEAVAFCNNEDVYLTTVRAICEVELGLL